MRKDNKVYWSTVLTPEEALKVDSVAEDYGSRADFLKAVVAEKSKDLKDRHSYPKQSIGASDMASLVFRFPGCLSSVGFGEDGSYSAYITDKDCRIPACYTLVCEGCSWLKVYDDTGLAYTAQGNVIKVYRSGGFGCIIQIL